METSIYSKSWVVIVLSTRHPLIDTFYWCVPLASDNIPVIIPISAIAVVAMAITTIISISSTYWMLAYAVLVVYLRKIALVRSTTI